MPRLRGDNEILQGKGVIAAKITKDNPEDLPLCPRSTGDKANLRRKEEIK
jgi:hypothetical protein